MTSVVALSNDTEFNDAFLDPISRTSEVLFGLIMVLSFTCSLSVAEVARSDVREMLISALGCNTAWGIIDAFFYLLGLAAQRGRERLLFLRLQNIDDQKVAQELFRSVVPESIYGSLSATSFHEIREHLLKTHHKQSSSLLTLGDMKSTLVVFALVFLTTFPVAVPFMLMTDAPQALRVSNAVAILMLMSAGYTLGRYSGRNPWVWGIGMAIIGALMVSMTIALGG